MPSFTYRAARTDGTVLEERATADDVGSLTAQLQARGLLVLQVRPAGIFPSVARIPSFAPNKIHPRDFAVFCQEFLALTKAGLPIIRTMDILVERGQQSALKEALAAVRTEIKGGSTMADAMAKYPRVFPELFTASLRAGEKSGNLVEIVARYLAYLRRVLELKKKVRSALSYPLFLLGFSAAVLVFLLLYVVPTFTTIYGEAHAEIPVATRILIAFVRGFRYYSIFLLAGGAITWIVFHRWIRTTKGRLAFDGFQLRLPLVGKVLWAHNIVRTSRTLSTVLRGGIPMIGSLEMVGGAITNREVSRRVESAAQKIVEGAPLSGAFSATGLLPRMGIEMVEVGEATGALPEMLDSIAEFYEEELDLSLSRLTTWIEPLLLIGMGLVVAVIVVLMYLPIFNLAGTIR